MTSDRAPKCEEDTHFEQKGQKRSFLESICSFLLLRLGDLSTLELPWLPLSSPSPILSTTLYKLSSFSLSMKKISPLSLFLFYECV